jgi:hypothetical protein
MHILNMENEMPTKGYTIQNTHVYSLKFADYQVLIAQDHDNMEFMARKIKDEYEKCGHTLNLEKTKYISVGEEVTIKFDSGKKSNQVENVPI